MKNTAHRKKISFVNLLVAVFVFLNRTRLKRKNVSMFYLDASYYIHVDSLRWGLYVDSHSGIFVSRFIQKHSDTTNILDASAGFWHKSTIIGIHVSSAIRTMRAALFLFSLKSQPLQLRKQLVIRPTALPYVYTHRGSHVRFR